MLTNSLLYRLEYQHESITETISQAKHKLFNHPQPGKWSIHDNIAHLARYQPVFLERINKILSEDEPFFERYSAETDPQFEEWRKQETEKLLNILYGDRKKIFFRIKGLSKTEKDRIGTHEKFGRLTIIDWTEFFLLHEAHHIYTIFQIVKSE